MTIASPTVVSKNTASIYYLYFCPYTDYVPMFTKTYRYEKKHFTLRFINASY